MKSNPFVTNPIKVVVYDPTENVAMHVFCLLGDAPKNVVNATINDNNPKLLAEFYGDSYKKKLCYGKYDSILDPLKSVSGSATGGYELSDNVNLRDLYMGTSDVRGGVDDAMSLDSDADIAKLLAGKPVGIVSKPIASLKFVPGVTYDTTTHIYPEDRLYEIKNKICVITRIPTYRQHVFYMDKNQQLRTTYKIISEGYHQIDIRNLSGASSDTHKMIHGIPIDNHLYKHKLDTKVETFEPFLIMSELTMTNNVIFVVDLAHYITNSFSSIIADVYQCELLYYGFVIKYWPQLTLACFQDYVTGERDMSFKYPDLAVPYNVLEQTVEYEREIVDKIYKDMSGYATFAERNGIDMAITQINATITNSSASINVRNLLDKLVTSERIPEIRVHTDHENRKYIIHKRHINVSETITFPSSLKHSNVIVIAIRINKSKEAEEDEVLDTNYIFLTILTNGRYFVRANFFEEDMFDFNDVLTNIKKYVDPVISHINSFGKFVFNTSKTLPHITYQNIDYKGLTVCLFWKRVVTDKAFRLVNDMWESYVHANIISRRQIVNPGEYEFMFRKGAHKFQTHNVEKILQASNDINLINYYSYLSNNTIKQKWYQHYDGRIMKVNHRTSDIVFKVVDIHEVEFKIFYNYIVSFIKNVIGTHGNSLGYSGISSETKVLRKLKEQDPILFNLKKYGYNRVYSQICQKKNQPIIYSEHEISSMSVKERTKLFKYWNITVGKPAYYGCPNKNFPRLGFIINSHPKNYCLPCCQKETGVYGDKYKKIIESQCIKNHSYNPESSNISKYLMTYGKPIDYGRIAKIPESLSELFIGTDTTVALYLYGVHQHLPGISNIGTWFALCEAINVKPELVVHTISKAINGAIFNTMMGGILAEYFKNEDELRASFIDLFLQKKQFSRELQKFKQWQEFVINIFMIIYNINVVTFVDANGNINLTVPPRVKHELQSDTTLSTKKYILLLRYRNSYYPLFAINKNNYNLSSSIEARTFTKDSPVIHTIYEMTMFATADSTADSRSINLEFMMRVCNSIPWKITGKFVNKQNICYAILVCCNNNALQSSSKSISGGYTTKSHKSSYGRNPYEQSRGVYGKIVNGNINTNTGGVIYFPIEYSTNISDGIPEVFEIGEYSTILVEQFLRDINGYLLTVKHKPIVATHIVSSGNPLVAYGIYVKTAEQSRELLVFCQGTWSESLPVVDTMYNYAEVNKAIMKSEPPKTDNRITGISAALYNNYLYQLFITEFVNYVDNDRNEEIRGKLRDIFSDKTLMINFNVAKTKLQSLLRDKYLEDFHLILHQIDTYFTNTQTQTIKTEKIADAILAHTYTFDKMIIQRIQKLKTREEIRAEIAKITNNFIIVNEDFNVSDIKFPNMYVPCKDLGANTGYCGGPKKDHLIINKPIDEFIDLLAADITNPLKVKYILNNIWSDIIVDYFNFEEHPDEVVKVYPID